MRPTLLGLIRVNRSLCEVANYIGDTFLEEENGKETSRLKYFLVKLSSSSIFLSRVI